MRILRVFLIASFISSLAITGRAQDTVEWFDDFLGSQIRSEYTKVPNGGAVIIISSAPGLNGSVLLSTVGSLPGNARMRLGEEPGTGSFGARHWLL